jgi:Pectate lyase superfamily protein
MSVAQLNRVWGYAYRRPPTPNTTHAPLGLAPGATITVFQTGTVVAALLYSDATQATPLANPFLADANAFYHFYTPSRVDIQFSGVGVLAPYTIGDARPADEWVYNVRNYGATGDGVTNDTAAIQLALDAAATDGGGAVFFPPGVYLVAPSISGAIILTLNSTNLRLYGLSSTLSIIRVAANVLPYRAIVAGVVPNATDLTGLEVSDLGFDHNIANNPVVSQASLLANPQLTVLVFLGTDLRFRRLHIVNATSVQNLVANGAAVQRVEISDCICDNLGDDPNHVTHDSSVFYVAAHEAVIRGNQINGGLDRPGVHTGIETHCPNLVVADNAITGWWTGILISGVSIAEDHQIAVTGNVISDVTAGIVLWSQEYSTHLTGFGLNGVVVAGNTIGLSGLAAWPTHSPNVEYGIYCQVLHDNLDIANLVIADNVITHPLEGVAVPNNTASLGIGWYSSNNKALWNAAITDNLIVNFPMAGIRFTCELHNVVIAGNTLVNCGSTLVSPMTEAYRDPMTINVNALTIDGLSIRDNIFKDSLTDPVLRPQYFLYLQQTGLGVSNGIEIVDNAFHSTGSAMTGQIRLDDAAATMKPYLRGAIASFVPTNSANQQWKAGSQVIDTATGIVSTIASNLFTWKAGLLATQLASYVRRLHAYGTALTAGDFVLTGWGANPVVTVVGTDQAFILIITADAVPVLNPTAVLTWKDGVWPSGPIGVANKTGGNGASAPIALSANVNTATVQFLGLPVAGLVYQFGVVFIGPRA